MKVYLSLLFILISSATFAQKKKAKIVETPTKPALVVGIVIDQMRYDYLYRYYDKYSDGGFKRLMNQGFNCKNNHYHYAATYTGPGHAAVYTGSSPAINGIVGNEWFDRNNNKTMYVAADSTVKGVGIDPNALAGKMSPKNLLSTTITDQLRLATDFRSKVIGISIKDRGAIMPAGHTANAAYWYDSKSGNFVSSSFYMNELPKWLQEFNAEKNASKYLSQTWNTLLPKEQYIESEEDEEVYENTLSGETTTTFPHHTKPENFAVLPATPWGNSILKDLAFRTIQNENMGKDSETDFLAISFSSPDYIGHYFGTHSLEIEDNYLRLDRDIAELLTYLDGNIGKGKYLVFLTADHGVADIPAYLTKHKVPAGVLDATKDKGILNGMLAKKFGEGTWITEAENQQLYLNKSLLADKKVSVEDINQFLKEATRSMPGVRQVVNLHELAKETIPEPYYTQIVNAYNPKRSGDIMILLDPAWFYGYGNKGTTHGTMYAYDTHVPLLFYGWKVKQGQTARTTYISDIAPTLAQFLSILEPSGTNGKPIVEVLE